MIDSLSRTLVMIRHILLIRFNEKATEQSINELMALFEAMPSKIAGVEAVEWGVNDSPEGKNKSYTHSVMMTFKDENGRQNYLPHPEHDALKSVFRPILDDIIVFDYSV